MIQPTCDELKHAWEANHGKRVTIALDSSPHPNGEMGRVIFDKYSAFSEGKRAQGVTPELALEALEQSMGINHGG